MDLASLQAWMLSAITEPESFADDAARCLRPGPALSAAEGLAIYQLGYRARLLECLRGDFPALRAALGDPLFERFALDYLARHPPRSYTLGRLAERFPEHLAATRPDAAEPPAERESWPDFVIELAAYERAVAEVYAGPGPEGPAASGARLLDPDELRDVPEPDLLAARFPPVPGLRLLEARYPVAAFAAAVRVAACSAAPGAVPASPPLPSPRPTFLVLHRRDFTVRVTELEPAGFRLLAALIGGATLGAARAALPAELAAQAPLPAVRGWLLIWAVRGLLSADARSESASG